MKKIKNKKQKTNTSRAFTLIELMVATSIFMVVMLVAMGSLVVTSDSAKKANALNFTMDNLNFAMESMTRSIRMGTNYFCGLDLYDQRTFDCPEGGTAITFSPAGAESDRMSYNLADRQNGTETRTIKRCITSGSSCVDVIADNIDIDILKFFVRGSERDSLVQPSVYMIVKGTITIKNEPISFAIQTMISQRTAEQ